MTHSTSGELRRRSHWRPFRLLVAFATGLTVLGTLVYLLVGWHVRSSAQQTIQRAARFFADGRLADARNSVGWLLWFEPEQPLALELVGRTFQIEGKQSEAADRFARISPSAENHEAAGFLFALAMLHTGDYETAEHALTRHLERYPDSAETRGELKWLLFNQLRRRESEELLNRRLRRTPHDFSLLFDLLYMEFRKQVPREAVAYLNKANDAKPGQPSVLLALGYCSWQLGDFPLARDLLDQALQLRPQHLETRLIVAEFLMDQDQPDIAERVLMPADEAGPLFDRLAADDRWWWLRSRLSQLRGDDTSAMTFAERPLKMRPFELRYVQGCAALLQAAGKAKDAQKLFRRAEQLESYESRLKEIALSGQLQQPSPALCREVAELCAQRGRTRQAKGWHYVALTLISAPR